MRERMSEEEKKYLLTLARETLEACVKGNPLPRIEDSKLTPILRSNGASFVTLTIHGELRGCIGALEPYQPLAEDVREHTMAAAQEDYRFHPVREEEIPSIAIEISRLTTPVPLDYRNYQDLVEKLNPGIDGVILHDGFHRATFLPQVWEKLPREEDFLSNLCYKMGVAPDTWRVKHLEVLIYQVEDFHE